MPESTTNLLLIAALGAGGVKSLFMCRCLKGPKGEHASWVVVVPRGRAVVEVADRGGRAVRSSREADASRCGPRGSKEREVQVDGVTGQAAAA